MFNRFIMFFLVAYFDCDSTMASSSSDTCTSCNLSFKLRLSVILLSLNEPRCEKTGLRGFRSGPTQTGLYSHRIWLEALYFGLR